MKDTITVGVLDFVKRQTKDSPYNHFDGRWEELTDIVLAQWVHRHVSPHNSGVVLVPIPPEQTLRFYTSIIPVTKNLPLKAQFEARTEKEAPFIQVTTPYGEKTPARYAEIILYSHETLAQDGDAPDPQEADYYIVSINAYAQETPEPMRPITMARNFLNLTGGTQPEKPYTAEEFAKAIIFWSQHVRLDP